MVAVPHVGGLHHRYSAKRRSLDTPASGGKKERYFRSRRFCRQRYRLRPLALNSLARRTTAIGMLDHKVRSAWTRPPRSSFRQRRCYFMCEGLTAVSSTSAQSSITVFQNSQLWTAAICSAVVTWLLPAG